jgi:CheY-like chemotaxis protein/HPt (histidine-containing phosphotransfer) domain-containing protein
MTAAARVPLVLVEDDPIVRAWVRACLESTEFVIVGEAEGASEALELVSRTPPAVLLVDYHLPDGNGVDVVRKLRMAGSRAPALLLTAHLSSDLREAAAQSGMQGGIAKSPEPAPLLDALRRLAAGETAFDIESVDSATEDAAEMTLDPAEQQRVLAAFRRTAGNHLVGLASDVAKLDGTPDEVDPRLRERILLHAHTLRGAAAVAGLHDVANIASAIEGLVEAAGSADVSDLRRLKVLVAELSVRIRRLPTSSEPAARPVSVDAAEARGTVLCIDDDPASSKLVEIVLAKIGIRTVAASSAAAGIRTAAQLRPDLVFLDHRLPDMNGLDALAQLRLDEATARIPVVMLTADSHGGAARFLEAGAHEVVTKPFELSRVVDVVRRHLPATVAPAAV